MNRINRIVKEYFIRLNMTPGHVIISAPVRDQSEEKSRVWINFVLFIATFITTSLAGSQTSSTLWGSLLSGLPYSVTIMSILLGHEMGHYLSARRFGLRATLPFFIPVPFPSPTGTMGAVIKMKSPIRDRRALLYIGAMGPIAGFVLSLIAVIVGMCLSEVKPLPAPTAESPVLVFGDSILFALITRIIHGAIPHGYDVFLSPLAWAGWIGFLVTSLNLMPLGQLDGSHILYSLVGRKQIFAGWSAFVGLILLSFFWQGWIVWIIMTLTFLRVGHPPVEDIQELTAKEKIMGWTCMIIWVLTFIPSPVDIIEAAV